MSQEAVVNKRIQVTGNRSKLRTMVQIAMLSAVSAVLMMFEFPIPFLAPPFIKMDFSEIPVLVGTFAMGPLAGVVIELLKNILHFVTYGTTTGGIGELSNFFIGCAFAVPAGIFYRKRKTRKNAVLGMATGTLLMVIMGCLSNAFVMFPLYSVVMGIPMDSFIAMGTAIHPAIDNMVTFVVLCMVPFNLVKGIIISMITLLLYKRLKVVLKGE
ncbi:ECF transporter S component [Blautia hansenii]|nr:ECF transporter S component [Blautia hansenii]UWO10988.1 ECF transporter S component [Blautia hansenii DSM 20583]